MPRTYRLKRRAEQQNETRERIVEAAIELHTTLGPARTSIVAIAERAGVERPTVYRHFPTTEALLRRAPAITGHSTRRRIRSRGCKSAIRQSGCGAGSASSTPITQT